MLEVSREVSSSWSARAEERTKGDEDTAELILHICGHVEPETEGSICKREGEREEGRWACSLPPSLTPIPLIRFAASPSPVSGAEKRDAGTRPLAKQGSLPPQNQQRAHQ